MDCTQVVYQTRRAGGGTVWVRRRRGSWRAIRFDSAPTALGKLLGLARVLGRIGSATTTVLPDLRLVAQVAAGPESGTPLTPRAGPARGQVQISGP